MSKPMGKLVVKRAAIRAAQPDPFGFLGLIAQDNNVI